MSVLDWYFSVEYMYYYMYMRVCIYIVMFIYIYIYYLYVYKLHIIFHNQQCDEYFSCSESQTCIQSEWTLKHYFVAYLYPHLYCPSHLILKHIRYDSTSSTSPVFHISQTPSQKRLSVKSQLPRWTTINIWSIWDHLGASKFQGKGTTTLWPVVVKPFFSTAIN